MIFFILSILNLLLGLALFIIWREPIGMAILIGGIVNTFVSGKSLSREYDFSVFGNTPSQRVKSVVRDMEPKVFKAKRDKQTLEALEEKEAERSEYRRDLFKQQNALRNQIKG